MNGCTQESFELSKIKVLKEASGIVVDFSVQREVDGSLNKDIYTKESATFAHPDLLNPIYNLKDLLIKSIGKETIHTERLIAGMKGLFKKEADYLELEQIFEDHMKGEKSKIIVSGISLSGFDLNKGVTISGTYQCKNGAKISINSPRIRFAGEHFTFERELHELCEIIEREAYLYVFKDKAAQGSLIFDEEGE